MPGAAFGENIASGQSSVDSVIAAWLGSEPHCRNIMNPLFTELAVACVNVTGRWNWAGGKREGLCAGFDALGLAAPTAEHHAASVA